VREYAHVIGCDGAHSMVRKSMNIPLQEVQGTHCGKLQSLVNVHFTSHALSQHARTAPAMLYFVVR
jgi:2-polyprenyl-6-methoxyphenol hydroxylase-like FAD-dependent oxidoreductase